MSASDNTSDVMYRLLVQSVVDYAIYMLTPDGRVANWNPGAQRAKGYRAEEIVGEHFSRFYSEEDRARGLPEYGLQLARTEGRFAAQGWRLRKDGSRFWASVVIDAIRDDQGTLIGFAKITRDMSEPRQAELALLEAKELAEKYSEEMAGLSSFLDSVITHIPASLLVIDVASREILLANTEAERLFGDENAHLQGRSLDNDLSASAARYLSRQLELVVLEGSISAQDDVLDTRIGRRTLRTRGLCKRHQGQSADYLLLISEDVSEEIAARRQINHMALHDALTGLPNRTLFHQRLDEALFNGQQQGCSSAVLCLDLDHFKQVNDSFGHTFGDKLLRAVTLRLQRTLPPNATLARFGGDEFAVVLPLLEQVEDSRRIAQRMIEVLVPPFELEEQSFNIGLSIGIALAPEHQVQGEALLVFADMALYEAKRNGRNRATLFHPDIEASARRRRTLESELRDALQLEQLQMYYQPIVDAAGEQIVGYEALMRWHHPVRGTLLPNDFIPLAEETGLIQQLGVRALELSCQEAVHWEEQRTVSVNLSPLQFRHGDLADNVRRALEHSGLEPGRLELEITESVLLDNSEENLVTLRALKALGVRIALDDFGTGYSSLGYLRSFPFDRIKIDQSFVQDMHQSRESAAIVRAILGMSDSLVITTTAEGVESEDQLVRLQAQGCTHFQGYLFGHPQPSERRLRHLG